MLAWPSMCWTYFGCVPRPRSNVAAEWRRSCSLMFGKPARFKSGAKWRLTTFSGSTGVPMVVVKTRSESAA